MLHMPCSKVFSRIVYIWDLSTLLCNAVIKNDERQVSDSFRKRDLVTNVDFFKLALAYFMDEVLL